MALERFFGSIGQALMREASELSIEAYHLIRKGDKKSARVKLDQSGEKISQAEIVESLAPMVLEMFDSAGIERPPVEFLQTLIADLPSQPPSDDVKEDQSPNEIKNSPEEQRINIPSVLRSLPGEPPGLIEQYIDSPYFVQHSELIETTKANGTDQSELQSRLSGIVFEELGYLYLKNKYQQNNVYVLSPSETFELYHRLYPDKGIEPHKGFKPGIKGVTFPDGIIIRDNQDSLVVDAVIDYKSSAQELHYDQRTKKQFENYSPSNVAKTLTRFELTTADGPSLTIGNIIHEIRRDIPVKSITVNPDAKILVGVPSNSRMLEGILDHTQVERIPVHSHTLSVLIDHLIASPAKN